MKFIIPLKENMVQLFRVDLFFVSLKFRSYNVACTELSLATVISPFDVINCLATQKFEVNDLEI